MTKLFYWLIFVAFLSGGINFMTWLHLPWFSPFLSMLIAVAIPFTSAMLAIYYEDRWDE